MGEWMRRAWMVGLVALGLSGCGSTPVKLTYSPAGVAAKTASAQPVVEVADIADARKNASPRIGAIRGGYGNPVKTLDAAVPVKDMVRQAFSDGLAARGLLAAPGSGAYELNITIKRLDSSQLMRREAHAHFDLALSEKGSGRPAFQRGFEDDRVDQGDLGGVFGDVEVLRKFTNDSLQAAIDKALDDPAFIAAIGTPPLPPLASAVPPQSNGGPAADRLRDLQALYDQKLITKSEYDARRRVILGSL